MVQLFQDQLLQLVSRLALPGVNAGLSQQFLGVDLGLGQEQPTFSSGMASQPASSWN
jgi:hypothetical protein